MPLQKDAAGRRRGTVEAEVLHVAVGRLFVAAAAGIPHHLVEFQKSRFPQHMAEIFIEPHRAVVVRDEAGLAGSEFRSILLMQITIKSPAFFLFGRSSHFVVKQPCGGQQILGLHDFTGEGGIIMRRAVGIPCSKSSGFP